MMAALKELADGYRDAAIRLKLGIEDAEEKLTVARGGEFMALSRDLAAMRQMLRDVREVGDIAEHYYDKGYSRNNKYTI